MRPIPPKLREEMENDPFYQQCCITGKNRLQVKIEFHHNLIFRGRQISEKFCILPVSKDIHDNQGKREIKDKLNWIMLNRATEEQLEKYSKCVDYKRMLKVLNKKFGKYKFS